MGRGGGDCLRCCCQTNLGVALWGDGNFHQVWDVDGQQLPPGGRDGLDGFVDGVINAWLRKIVSLKRITRNHL